MPAPLQWTKSQTEFVIGLYCDGTSPQRIAKMLGVSEAPVISLLKKAGVTLRSMSESALLVGARGPSLKRLPPNIEQQIVDGYSNHLPTFQIAESLGICRNTVANVLKRNGIALRSHARRYSFNDNFFASIDTEEKAYWLGFITADGCVTSGRVLQVSLAQKDERHLDNLKQALGYSGPLYRRGPGGYGGQDTVLLMIGSKKMVADLGMAGVGPRKSLTAAAWDGHPDLIRHYWRGVIDGDGCVGKRADGGWSIECVGSRQMMGSLAAYFSKIVGSPIKSHAHKMIFRVRVSGVRKAQIVAKLLYEGATVSLERKAKVAAEIIADVPKSVYRFITYHGTTMRLHEWAKRCRVPTSVFQSRQVIGWPDEKIIETPVRFRGPNKRRVVL